MKKNRIVVILTLFNLLMQAQEKLGISNSNYSSTNSIYLNPASSVDSRTYMQLNLLGLNAYVMNNIFYLPKFSVWSSIKHGIRDPELSSIKLKKFVYAKAELNAPSFVYSAGEIGFGIFIRGRMEADTRNIPYELAQMFLEANANIDTSTIKKFNVDIKNAKIAQMSWMEYGVNFGKMFSKHGDVIMSVGGNAKYLTGINIFYANLARFQTEISDKAIDIKNIEGKLRYNFPGWDTGKGFGGDFGFTYKKMRDWVDSYFSNSPKYNCKYIDYQYKIGVSLLDLGAIRFTRNTYKASISGQTRIDSYETTNLDSLFKEDFKTSQEINKPIWASLPTALSIQADWNMSYYLNFKKDQHLYVNITAVQGLTTPRVVGVQRANLISVAPRYERKNIEVALPLTFHRYIYPQLGCAVRYRTFVLGMDNIFPLITKKDTYGLNVYFNFGISIFKNPACRPKRKKTSAKAPSKKGTIFSSHKKKTSKAKDNLPDVEEKKKGKKVDDCPELPVKKETEKDKKEIEKEQKTDQ